MFFILLIFWIVPVIRRIVIGGRGRFLYIGRPGEDLCIIRPGILPSSVFRKQGKMASMYLVAVLFLAVACELISATETYTDKFDNIDVDKIIASERLLKQYTNCILDKGNCTPDGRTFKELLPDAVATKCVKCTEKQKEIVKKVSKHLMDNKPDEWQLFVTKFDANGTYRKDFEEFLNN